MAISPAAVGGGKATWVAAMAHLHTQLAAGEAMDADHASRVTAQFAGGPVGFLRWWLLLRSEAAPLTIAESTALRQRGLWRQALINSAVVQPTGISGGILHRGATLEAVAALSRAGRWAEALRCVQAAASSVSVTNQQVAASPSIVPVRPPSKPVAQAPPEPPTCPEAAAVALVRAPSWQQCLRGCSSSLVFLAGPSRCFVEGLMLQTAHREGQWAAALAYIDAARRTTFTPAVCCLAAEISIDHLRDSARAMVYLNVLVRRYGTAAVPADLVERLAVLAGRPSSDVAEGIARFAERVKVARTSKPGEGKKAARKKGGSREQLQLDDSVRGDAAAMAAEVLRVSSRRRI